MAITLGLAGDTMLGRMVAEAIEERGPASLFAPEVVEVAGEADLFVCNLECCISERGEPWPEPGKPFFFRAPPSAVEALVMLGVDCVTLANNHALDFGEVALLDTIEHLRRAGIAVAGAGPDVGAARAPAVVSVEGFGLAVVGLSDHPADFGAGPGRPGMAYAALREGLPPWVGAAVGEARAQADAVLVTPHWGPNMVSEPVPWVRETAPALVEAGATLVAGHSAHVFHGVAGSVLWDLGDFVDDYRVDAVLRNDLGLLWLVKLEGSAAVEVEAVPLALDYCHTRLASGEEAAWVRSRLRAACAALGTPVEPRGERLVAPLI